jgi:hypothetical protein
MVLAYIDPGTGSLVFQAAMVGLLAVASTTRAIRNAVAAAFARLARFVRRPGRSNRRPRAGSAPEFASSRSLECVDS